MHNETMTKWHEIVQEKNVRLLDEILADDVVFHSPIVHTPQVGRGVTKLYLVAAQNVLVNESFRYVREVVNDKDAVLEFVVEIDGIKVNGVDMITWNDEGLIVDVKVMLRPLKAIHLIHSLMAAQLDI